MPVQRNVTTKRSFIVLVARVRAVCGADQGKISEGVAQFMVDKLTLP